MGLNFSLNTHCVVFLMRTSDVVSCLESCNAGAKCNTSVVRTFFLRKLVESFNFWVVVSFSDEALPLTQLTHFA